MATFKIEYKDPETGERREVEFTDFDTADFTARYWAEDYGYTLADKGWYKVTEIE